MSMVIQTLSQMAKIKIESFYHFFFKYKIAKILKAKTFGTYLTLFYCIHKNLLLMKCLYW